MSPVLALGVVVLTGVLHYRVFLPALRRPDPETQYWRILGWALVIVLNFALALLMGFAVWL